LSLENDRENPCIRGLRITVYDILNVLADGMMYDEVLDDYPKLTQEDILACLVFAADKENKDHDRPSWRKMACCLH